LRSWYSRRSLAGKATLRLEVGDHILPPRSKLASENQHEENDQYDTKETDTAVTVAVSVTAKATTEAAKQEDDENNNEYESK